MPDPLYDEINASTKEEIYPSIIEDHFFKGAPLLAYLRNQGVHPFYGGSRMQTAFNFRPQYGGAYAIGDQFTTLRTPSLSAMRFEPRYYYAAVPEFKETIQVVNNGPNAIFDLVETDMRNAMQTINAIIAVALYREGTTAARSSHLNGLSEAIGNGTDPSWDGTIATTYGSHTRNGAIGGSLNATPLWVGTSAGAAGPIMYRNLVSSYDDATKGADEPNLGLMNKAVMGYILQRMQPQQRFAEEQDPYWGATCFRFRRARMMVDEYAPSLTYGESHAILGSNLTSSFTSPASPTSGSQLPSSTACTVGEVFMWLNTRTLLFRLADDEEFGFGWSGFIPSQFDTRVIGYIKAALNLQCLSPKLNKQIYGIGS
jgi:hypothetical protein